MDLNQEFVKAKKGQWWQFPVQIGIEIVGGKNYLLEHKFHGLAQVGREREVVIFGGWAENQASRFIGTVDWAEGNNTFPSNTLELFVLKGRLIMN